MSTFLDSREERIQLEKERLERQRKRLREESERGGGKGKEKSTGYGDESILHQIEPTAKKARVETAAQGTNAGSSTHSERFWDGAIRQTANRHVDTKKDTRPIIRLSDIIAPVSCYHSTHHNTYMSIAERRDSVCYYGFLRQYAGIYV